MTEAHQRKTRRVLALDAWLGGSHLQFLEGWKEHSAHEVEIRGLRARSFRWRMRSSAWQFARDLVAEKVERPEALLVTGFTDVAGLLGMLPSGWRELPVILYMHENQLSYPRRDHERDVAERDHHLGFSQILSCLAADVVVFNSEFHRAEFAQAAELFLKRLPKPNPRQALEKKMAQARVIAPGIDLNAIPLGPGAPADSPLRVLFNQRWEWDKAPQTALQGIEQAVERGTALEVCLLGEHAPVEISTKAKIVHAGFASDRTEYADRLGRSDVVVSTALHEFFGIAVGEAIAAGCTPILPHRLAYPELAGSVPGRVLFRGKNEAECVADALIEAARSRREHRDPDARQSRRAAMSPFSNSETARQLDRTLEDQF